MFGYRYWYAVDGLSVYRFYSRGIRNLFVTINKTNRAALPRTRIDQLLRKNGYDSIQDIPEWGINVKGLVLQP